MKIAILGANGYIGSYLCKYFRAQGHEVLAVTRDTVNLYDYQQVQDWLKLSSPEIVINSAISGGGATIDHSRYNDLQNNLTVFFNFYNSEHSFRYINIGSGAEFDRTTNIELKPESGILFSNPKDSYGFSKNIIARSVLSKDNFFTLRLFGCFHTSEPIIRLFKRFLTGHVEHIQNRYFDYFSLTDFVKVLEYYCTTNMQPPKDLNCVYLEKYNLVEILSMIKKIKLLDIPVYTDGRMYNSYTGDGTLLYQMSQQPDFPRLDGLEKGLEKYE